MMSPEWLYPLLFGLLSAGIGWALVWPDSRRAWGPWLGLNALAVATLLGIYLAAVGGAAVFRHAPPALSWVWLQPWVDELWSALQAILTLADVWLPGLADNLVLIPLFLAAYLALKLVFVTLAWVAHAISWLLRHAFRDPLPPYTGFLKDAARWGLPVCGGLLGSIPYAMAGHPDLAAFFENLFWAGAWIALLELSQWLRSAGMKKTAQDELEAPGTDATAPSLERLYNEYLRLNEDPQIGDNALLLYRGIDPPLPAPAAASRNAAQDDGEIARQFIPRLRDRLPTALMEEMVHLANRYERGADLFFNETLCGHHFLLLAELIQHHKNRAEVILLICAHSAIGEVEAALQRQVDLYQLRLTHRWAVLGRDPVGPDAQVDLLICPDTALEENLLRRVDALPMLHRLRLLICLDIQTLPLSCLRLALGRLWLQVPRERVRVVVQAQPHQGMEQQIRYVLDFPPQLVDCRLNPQLLAKRYCLVWDAQSAHRDRLLQHYFAGYQGTLEMGRLLLLAPWQEGFAVVDLDPRQRHDENSLEHLRHDLLAKYGHQTLVKRSWHHETVGHIYAAGEHAVYQCENLTNLPLALDHNANFSGAEASLLNIVCGQYLLRDFFLACLAGAGDPRNLPMRLRPLAVRPQGTLPEIAAALASALEAHSGQDGLSRQEIAEQYLNLAPKGLRDAFRLRADWEGLRKLFAIALPNPPRVEVRWGGNGEPRYAIDTAGGQRFALQRSLWVCNEAGERIGFLPAEDQGLCFAKGQLVLVGGKFQRISTVDDQAYKISVQHQESEETDIRRHYVFSRRYVFNAGDIYREVAPQWQTLSGDLQVAIEHRHAAFTGISEGYWTLTEDRRFPGPNKMPTYVALEPSLQRVHRLQNVAHILIRQPGLFGNAERSTVAFTLCAVLQDCLESLFPQQFRRLAMVSPQSSRFASEQDELTRCFHRLYPALEPIKVTLDKTPDEKPDELDLYLFEDADHDLGVVRTIGDGKGISVLLGIARDYVAWATNQPPERLYQAYGAKELPDCLDYPGTLALLDKLAHDWVSPRLG